MAALARICHHPLVYLTFRGRFGTAARPALRLVHAFHAPARHSCTSRLAPILLRGATRACPRPQSVLLPILKPSRDGSVGGPRRPRRPSSTAQPLDRCHIQQTDSLQSAADPCLLDSMWPQRFGMLGRILEHYGRDPDPSHRGLCSNPLVPLRRSLCCRRPASWMYWTRLAPAPRRRRDYAKSDPTLVPHTPLNCLMSTTTLSSPRPASPDRCPMHISILLRVPSLG